MPVCIRQIHHTACRTVTSWPFISHIVFVQDAFRRKRPLRPSNTGKIASKIKEGRKEKKHRISAVVLKKGSEDGVHLVFPSWVQVQISRQCSAVLCSLLPCCVSETQSSGRFPFLAHVSVLESECLLLNSVPLWFLRSCSGHFSRLFPLLRLRSFQSPHQKCGVSPRGTGGGAAVRNTDILGRWALRAHCY